MICRFEYEKTRVSGRGVTSPGRDLIDGLERAVVKFLAGTVAR